VQLVDYAIAPDKQPLLPGQTATFANYTSYSRGINAIIVDVAGLPGAVTGADFVFRAGNSNTPSTWSGAPAPNSINTETDTQGIARIRLLWADGAIQKQWLQVTLKANANTGLVADDVFYFGNAIGETGNSPDDANVNPDDIYVTRMSQTGFGSAEINHPCDFNRDGRVNPNDIYIVRTNQSGFTPLRLISVPAQ
jgi:hypothetical protein